MTHLLLCSLLAGPALAVKPVNPLPPGLFTGIALTPAFRTALQSQVTFGLMRAGVNPFGYEPKDIRPLADSLNNGMTSPNMQQRQAALVVGRALLAPALEIQSQAADGLALIPGSDPQRAATLVSGLSKLAELFRAQQMKSPGTHAALAAAVSRAFDGSAESTEDFPPAWSSGKRVVLLVPAKSRDELPAMTQALRGRHGLVLDSSVKPAPTVVGGYLVEGFVQDRNVATIAEDSLATAWIKDDSFEPAVLPVLDLKRVRLEDAQEKLAAFFENTRSSQQPFQIRAVTIDNGRILVLLGGEGQVTAVKKVLQQSFSKYAWLVEYQW